MGLTPFRELPLSDKFMFGEVMRQEAVCKLFLEELLECKIATLRFSDKEVDISDAAYNHGIRLDVFLADENSTHYDIEMQIPMMRSKRGAGITNRASTGASWSVTRGMISSLRALSSLSATSTISGWGLQSTRKSRTTKERTPSTTTAAMSSFSMQSTRARAAYRRRLRNSLTMFEKATIWLCSRPNLQTWRNL